MILSFNTPRFPSRAETPESLNLVQNATFTDNFLVFANSYLITLLE